MRNVECGVRNWEFDSAIYNPHSALKFQSAPRLATTVRDHSGKPGGTPLVEQRQAFVHALRAILSEYRRFIAYSADL